MILCGVEEALRIVFVVAVFDSSQQRRPFVIIKIAICKLLFEEIKRCFKKK